MKGLAAGPALIFPVLDLLQGNKKIFLVWSTTLTRQGIAFDKQARGPVPRMLIGVARSRPEAERMAAAHG